MDCIDSRNTAAPDYLTRLLETTKPPVQVLLNIFYVFQAHRQPDQIIGNTGLVSLLRAQPAMGGGGRVNDGAFGIAQVGGKRKNLRAVDHLPCFTLPAFNAERQDAAKRTLLFGRQLMPRMGFQSRIDRKSTRLNSSHVAISYAVFCLKKKK